MMLKNYVELDASGIYPVRVGANFTVPEGAIEVDFDSIDYASCMYVDGMWETRPVIANPVIAGGAVSFSNLPEGSTITVFDIEASVDLVEMPEVAGVVEFELMESAEYIIRANLPLPWMPWEIRLTC